MDPPSSDRVPPTLLYKTVVDMSTGEVVSHSPVVENLVGEVPIASDDFEQSGQFYCAAASADGEPLPLTGISKVDTAEKQSSVDTWWADRWTDRVSPRRFRCSI